MDAFVDGYDEKVYVDNLVQKELATQKQKGGSFDPLPFIASFERALENLETISVKAEQRLIEASREKEKAHVEYRDKMSRLQGQWQDTMNKFTKIEEKVTTEGAKAIKIGEKLQKKHPEVYTEEDMQEDTELEENMQKPPKIVLTQEEQYKVSSILQKVTQLLTSKQKKDDFESDTNEFSPGCSSVISFLDEQLLEIDSMLEEPRKKTFLTTLGNKLFRVILDHIKKQKITVGSGGMSLVRDMARYREFMAKFDSSKVNHQFSVLKDVANIFIVANENLQSLISDSALAHLKPQDLNGLLHARHFQ